MVKPDITCSIEAVGPDGTPIDDGSSVTYGADEAVVRISFTAANLSSARSGQFWLRPCVRVNEAKAYDPPVEMMNLEPGESWTQEFSSAVSSPSEAWRASILVDINDFVDESDERNNRASLSFTALRSTP
jgi:hypothetical protein